MVAEEIFDVVVCGAGPVGLTAAAMLAARGVTVAVLEQHAGTSDEPKAISLDDEALRGYQRAGLVDRVLPILVPGTGTRYHDRHGRLAFHAGGAAPFRFGYHVKNQFAQPDLERVLAEALREIPGAQLRFNTRVVEFRQGPSTVAVRAETADGEAAFRASYVLGCDGGRSATRLLQDVGMTGRNHNEVWLVADTLADPHTERFAMHHGDPARPHVIVPGRDGRCRYEFRLFEGEGAAGSEPPFELIEKLVAPYRTLTPEQVERAVCYRFNAVVADRWVIGRSFLLGDAAHMMPPFAGQGLNSGIRDAINLTWKIADVLTGRLAPDALESYPAERIPHALATVRLSEQLGRLVMTTRPGLARARDEAVSRALRTRRGRRYLKEMRYRPAPRYSTGLVVASDSPPSGVPIGQPWVFDTGEHRVRPLDDVLGHSWALIGVEQSEKAWEAVEPIRSALEAREVEVVISGRLPSTSRPLVLEADGGLRREFSAYRRRFVLLRPDSVVAASWLPSDTDETTRHVLAWTPTKTRNRYGKSHSHD